MASDPNIQGNSHAAALRSVGIGNRNDNPAQWAPFTWDDPHFGPQVNGEVAPVAFDHTSGSLQLGFWRTAKGIPGCNEDGSCHVDYSAPLGDETMVILEGTATVTVTATGKRYRLEAGTIISHPKGVALSWDIDSPFLKKFWIFGIRRHPRSRTMTSMSAITATIPKHGNPSPGTSPTMARWFAANCSSCARREAPEPCSAACGGQASALQAAHRTARRPFPTPLPWGTRSSCCSKAPIVSSTKIPARPTICEAATSSPCHAARGCPGRQRVHLPRNSG